MAKAKPGMTLEEAKQWLRDFIRSKERELETWNQTETEIRNHIALLKGECAICGAPLPKSK